MPTENVSLLTVGDLAARWQIAEQTIRNAISRKSNKHFPVKPVRIGRSVRFRVADVERAESELAQGE